jgi:hypothetical protein
LKPWIGKASRKAGLPTQFPARGRKRKSYVDSLLCIIIEQVAYSIPRKGTETGQMCSVHRSMSVAYSIPRKGTETLLIPPVFKIKSKLLPTQFPARGRKPLCFHYPCKTSIGCLLNSPQGDGNIGESVLIFKNHECLLPTQFPARGRKRLGWIVVINNTKKCCLLNSPQGDGNMLVSSSGAGDSCLLNSPQGDGNLNWPKKMGISLLRRELPTQFPARGRKLIHHFLSPHVDLKGLPTQFPARGRKLGRQKFQHNFLRNQVAYSIPRKGTETYGRAIRHRGVLSHGLVIVAYSIPRKGTETTVVDVDITDLLGPYCVAYSIPRKGTETTSSNNIIQNLKTSCLLNSPQGDGNPNQIT